MRNTNRELKKKKKSVGVSHRLAIGLSTRHFASKQFAQQQYVIGIARSSIIHRKAVNKNMLIRESIILYYYNNQLIN